MNNQLIIDDWTAHTQDTTDSGQVSLQGGTRYDIRVEYYEGSGNATMQLEWSTPGGQLPVVIPKANLFPPTTPVPATSLIWRCLSTFHLLCHLMLLSDNRDANLPRLAS